MGELDKLIIKAEERPYWEDMDYSGANQIVKGNLLTGQRAAIAIGYYLKHIRDNQLYLEGGYQSFGEYVRAECGLSESTASRHISRMEQFSEGGNSPKLADRYAEYSASQLQEMLYLTDEQREQASPDMTVKEIRAIRQGENMVAGIDLACEHSDNGVCVILSDAETEQPCIEGPCLYEETRDAASEDAVAEVTVELPDLEDAPGPAQCITGQSGSGICGAAAYCDQPYDCCAQCDEDCNGRCGWIPRRGADQGPEEPLGHKTEPKRNPAMESQARMCLSNLKVEIGAKAWPAALASARHLVHYLSLVVGETAERGSD